MLAMSPPSFLVRHALAAAALTIELIAWWQGVIPRFSGIAPSSAVHVLLGGGGSL
jgi:hypothetical protein